jgi:hypothetical protein
VENDGIIGWNLSTVLPSREHPYASGKEGIRVLSLEARSSENV